MSKESRLHELKKLVTQLEKIRGRHTELVSVYVPAGYSLVDIMNQLRQEAGTAQNIKSKSTRKNVVTALEKIVQHLKIYKKTPDNGLAAFCGNISEQEGAADMRLWAIEPPEPLHNKLYWCDQQFVLDPLREMVKEKEVYGLIAVDKSEASIAFLRGKRIELAKHLESIVPSKTSKGGWSQARYARIREGLLNDFLKEVGDVASKTFKDNRELLGIIIGGPGPIKEMFIKDNYLQYEVQQKILGIVDISYTDESGLHELVERASGMLAQAAVTKEKNVLQKFFEGLRKDMGLVAYGFGEVKNALGAGAVQTLLLSEDFDWVHAKLRCTTGHELEKDMMPQQKQLCPTCGLAMKEYESEELLELLTAEAERRGAEVCIISTATHEGQQLKELGGIAAMLKYRLGS